MKYLMPYTIVLLLLSCGTEKEVIDKDHNSRVSLDWNGNYTGIIESNDLPKFSYNLLLKSDLTYSLSLYNTATGELISNEDGFKWDETGSIIELNITQAQIIHRFKVIEGELIALNDAQNPIEGNKNRLTKHESELVNKKWSLIELEGMKLKGMKDLQIPFVHFMDNRHVSGNASCNSYNGTFNTIGPAGLKFSPLAATKKFCGNAMDLEYAFFDALSSCDNYTINGDTLSLNKARQAPLARLVILE